MSLPASEFFRGLQKTIKEEMPDFNFTVDVDIPVSTASAFLTAVKKEAANKKTRDAGWRELQRLAQDHLEGGDKYWYLSDLSRVAEHYHQVFAASGIVQFVQKYIDQATSDVDWKELARFASIIEDEHTYRQACQKLGAMGGSIRDKKIRMALADLVKYHQGKIVGEELNQVDSSSIEDLKSRARDSFQGMIEATVKAQVRKAMTLDEDLVKKAREEELVSQVAQIPDATGWAKYYAGLCSKGVMTTSDMLKMVGKALEVTPGPALEEFKRVTQAMEGGLADGMPDDKFDATQLEMGVKVEMEHTNDPKLAKEIAKDHLTEIADYYTRLTKMENEAKQNKKSTLTVEQVELAREAGKLLMQLDAMNEELKNMDPQELGYPNIIAARDELEARYEKIKQELAPYMTSQEGIAKAPEIEVSPAIEPPIPQMAAASTPGKQAVTTSGDPQIELLLHQGKSTAQIAMILGIPEEEVKAALAGKTWRGQASAKPKYTKKILSYLEKKADTGKAKFDGSLWTVKSVNQYDVAVLEPIDGGPEVQVPMDKIKMLTPSEFNKAMADKLGLSPAKEPKVEPAPAPAPAILTPAAAPVVPKAPMPTAPKPAPVGSVPAKPIASQKKADDVDTAIGEAGKAKQKSIETIEVGRPVRIEGEPENPFYGQTGLVEKVYDDGYVGVRLRNTKDYLLRFKEDLAGVSQEDYTEKAGEPLSAPDVAGDGGLSAGKTGSTTHIADIGESVTVKSDDGEFFTGEVKDSWRDEVTGDLNLLIENPEGEQVVAPTTWVTVTDSEIKDTVEDKAAVAKTADMDEAFNTAVHYIQKGKDMKTVLENMRELHPDVNPHQLMDAYMTAVHWVKGGSKKADLGFKRGDIIEVNGSRKMVISVKASGLWVVGDEEANPTFIKAEGLSKVQRLGTKKQADWLPNEYKPLLDEFLTSHHRYDDNPGTPTAKHIFKLWLQASHPEVYEKLYQDAK